MGAGRKARRDRSTDRSLAADENASIVATRRRISSRRPSFPPPSDAPSPPLRAPSSSSPPLVRRSILAAAVSIGLFSALKPKVPFTQAEANICQTVASAAGSMTMAAGLIGPIPALQMLGHKYDGLTIMAWGASVAYLGVFFAVPMRRHFLVDHPLKVRSIHWSPYDPVGVVNAVPYGLLPACLCAHTSLSIPALDAFQLQLTPMNSTPTFARTERPSSFRPARRRRRPSRPCSPTRAARATKSGRCSSPARSPRSASSRRGSTRGS